jgi:fused signal recognition particle receptor
METIILAVVIFVVVVAAASGLVVSGRRRKSLPKPPSQAGTLAPPVPPKEPQVGEDAETPRDTPSRTVEDVTLSGEAGATEAEPAGATAVREPGEPEAAAEEPAVEVPEPTEGRLVRLRSRLSRSQNSLGKGLLTLLSRDRLDEDTWEEIEETLLTADVGVGPTQELVEALRTRVKVLGTRTPRELRSLLREELVKQLGDFDRSLHTEKHAAAGEGAKERPAVALVVGVNGTGKTTTTGKLARVLIADGRSVVLGAADTFRAAAADQLQTWGERVGARTVRGPEAGDPASVAFDAVKEGIEEGADTVLVDTAGRLHTKTGLMDELGKVKRVVEKHGPVDEVLLVLDATTGQNGLVQARVFSEVVNITGIVLTKLDGTAKGGIVIQVQRELGVPVKLIGLGEGADDLAPFDAGQYVDGLLGDDAE